MLATRSRIPVPCWLLSSTAGDAYNCSCSGNSEIQEAAIGAVKANPEFMRRAIALATENVSRGGGPFGCVVVRDSEILATGVNQVTVTNDPTAHAEVVAVRAACKALGSFQLHGCTVYTSCEPCPMCLAAIYWARLDRIFYACGRSDACSAGFDDEFIYKELSLEIAARTVPMVQLSRDAACAVFKIWEEKPDKVPY